MTMMEKISAYWKQFAGEVTGDQAKHDEGRREAARAVSDAGGKETIEADAAPQFEVSKAGRGNDGVSSAKPRVVTGSDDATVHRTPPGMEPPERDWSVGFDETAPRQDRPAPVADYSDVEQLKLFRLVPVAAANDTNWDNAPNQGEVVVRARSSGDARVVAAEAELDFMEIDALPGDGNSTTSSSAFRNEKLYTVVDETDQSYPVEGPREVVAGTVRVDNIRPSEF
jgi:hypothetical protein